MITSPPFHSILFSLLSSVGSFERVEKGGRKKNQQRSQKNDYIPVLLHLLPDHIQLPRIHHSTDMCETEYHQFRWKRTRPDRTSCWKGDEALQRCFEEKEHLTRFYLFWPRPFSQSIGEKRQLDNIEAWPQPQFWGWGRFIFSQYAFMPF